MYIRSATIIALIFAFPAKAAVNCEDLTKCNLSTEFENQQQLREFLKDWRKKRSQTQQPRPQAARALQTLRSATPNAPPTTFVVHPPTESLRFFLRKDFSDINLFSGPIPNAKATGAEFSWTRDRIAEDAFWSANATVALAYSYFVENIRDPFIGVTFATYLTVNREAHSKNVGDNIDNKKFGISGEIGYKNLIFGGADYLQGRLAIIQDDIRGTTITHATAEWLPTYHWKAGTVPGTPIRYTFMPRAKAQWDSTTQAGKTLLFSDRQEALRVGPEAILMFEISPDSPLPDYIKSFSGKIVYHWWTETYSGRQDSWLDATLVQNLDNNGFIALTYSYRHGRSELTGAKTDLFKIALSAKLCATLIGQDECARPAQ